MGVAGLGIDLDEDVLEHGLARVEIFAGDAVQLPQDAGLADGHHRLLVAMIDQDALEHFVQVEGLARRMAEIPFQLAGIGIQRQGRIGVERGAVAGAAQIAPPGLGLGGAPIGRVQLRIIGAGDPGFGAGALFVGQIAPGVAARLAASAPR